MYKQFIILNIAYITLISIMTSCRSEKDVTPLYKYVNTFIGTEAPGNTYPGAQYPFGMVQISPDNGTEGWNWISGYYYPDSTINGFSHTHLSGTGAGDLYDIRFMPAIKNHLMLEDSIKGVYALFDHKSEVGEAGFYKVTIMPYNIDIQLTALPHTAIQSYTFNNESDSAFVIVDLIRRINWDKTIDSNMEFVNGSTIQGYRYSTGWAKNQKIFFYSQLSKTPYGIELDSTSLGNGHFGYKAKLYFKVKKGDNLCIVTSISGVDISGAKNNFMEEATEGYCFDKYKAIAQNAWQHKLSTIKIDDGTTDDEKQKFYTALYHSMLCPVIYSDMDGRYLAPNGLIKKYTNKNKRYTTFSLWDTYRSAHPLYNIIAQEESQDMIKSLVDFAIENNNRLPVWNMWASETNMMIGYHSAPIITDAIIKGIYKPDDNNKIKEIFTQNLLKEKDKGLMNFNKIGYVPADTEDESVSKTIEYSFDDYAISLWAKHINDSAMYKIYSRNGLNFKNIYNPKVGFFMPRLKSGQFKEPFDPFSYSKDFTESNAYQYLFAIQNNLDQLISILGGVTKAEERLDDFFTKETPDNIKLPIFSTGMIGQYVQGNEPSHHVAYLYNIIGKPHKTVDIINNICDNLYKNEPKGLCGNEDCGQMSAWYIFSSIGFYPLDPVSNRYELVTPRFKNTYIALPNNKILKIKIDRDRKLYPYIKDVKLNGVSIKRSFITFEDINKGGCLEFILTKNKNHLWYSPQNIKTQ